RTYPSMPVVKGATASQRRVRYGPEGGAVPGAWGAPGPWAPAGVGSEAFSRLTAVLYLLHPVLVTLPRAGQRCDPTARRPAPQAATRPRPAGPPRPGGPDGQGKRATGPDERTGCPDRTRARGRCGCGDGAGRLRRPRPHGPSDSW